MHGPGPAPVAGLLHAGVFVSAGRALRRVTNKMAECRRRRRAYQELAVMSDHELEDIGVGRSDIDAILSGRYERAKPESSNLVAFDRCRYRERAVLKKWCNERG
jgi:uncharacterized protein YjiS (DUF1127 family)